MARSVAFCASYRLRSAGMLYTLTAAFRKYFSAALMMCSVDDNFLNVFRCQEPNKFPFCKSCARNIAVYQRLAIQAGWVEQRRFEVAKVCRMCLADDEHMGNNDFFVCANMQCSFNQTRLELERSLASTLIHAHSHHIDDIELDDDDDDDGGVGDGCDTNAAAHRVVALNGGGNRLQPDQVLLID